MSNYIIDPFFQFGGAPIPTRNAWVEIGRTTLGAPGSDIIVSSLPKKRYLMVLIHLIQNGVINAKVQYNADVASNYSSRHSVNGSIDPPPLTNQTSINVNLLGANASDNWIVAYIDNNPTGEKLSIWHYLRQQVSGTGTVPQRTETVAKWDNVIDSITQIRVFEDTAGQYDTGSEMVILGFDPADGLGATSNFWQELANVQLGAPADVISSGAIPATKYLWVQYYIKNTGQVDLEMTFNSDVGVKYAIRRSINGGADVTTGINLNNIPIQSNVPTGFQWYGDLFIVNKIDKEKLISGHDSSVIASGAGSVPDRQEEVSKWTDVVSQITQIDITNADAGDYDAGSTLKVWGRN